MLNQSEVRPVHFKWIILKNKVYDKLREAPGCAGFADLPAVDNDAVNVKKGVIGLGAKAMDIYIIEDTNFQSLKELFDDLTERVANGWSRGQETTFVFVYYTGHGVQANYTYAVLNNPDPRRWRFPLEMYLRTLGTNPGAWVVGIFDCC